MTDREPSKEGATAGEAPAGPPLATTEVRAEPISALVRAVPGLPRAVSFLPALVAAIAFAWFASFLPAVAEGQVFVWSRPWIESLDIDFAFRLDGLGLVFAMLITGIGALVLLYTAGYFSGDPRIGRLLTLLVLFAISMLGLTLADDAVTLFLFWEGTTVTSFLLVGFDFQKAYARRAALQALLITGLGGLALLGGLLVLGGMLGTYRISEMNAAGDAIRASAAYGPVLTLFCSRRSRNRPSFRSISGFRARWRRRRRSPPTCTPPRW